MKIDPLFVEAMKVELFKMSPYTNCEVKLKVVSSGSTYYRGAKLGNSNKCNVPELSIKRA